jgi:hypothetical protein
LESSAFEAAAKIMDEKCVVCHGENKQKGKLRLDSKDHMLEGGENGNLLGSRQETSLLIERILLPLDHEEHMPPTERKQLTQMEIDFFKWWIDNGADFDQSLAELSFPEQLHPLLNAGDERPINTLVPEQEVDQADVRTLQALKDLSVILLPVGASSNYLSASFVNVLPSNLSKSLVALNGLKDHLIWLNLDYQVLDSASWDVLGKLKNLRKLSLKNTNLNDDALKFLGRLEQLRYLNLVATGVTAKGLSSLKDLTNLESLFLYQANVSRAEQNELSALFPDAKIDYGNYDVPVLASDTTVFSLKDLK